LVPRSRNLRFSGLASLLQECSKALTNCPTVLLIKTNTRRVEIANGNLDLAGEYVALAASWTFHLATDAEEVEILAFGIGQAQPAAAGVAKECAL
jgi:hypothetical protein